MAGETEAIDDYDAADDCVKSYYAAIEAKRLRGDAEEIDDLARRLFAASDPSGIWAIADHGTQLYWRREAQRRLQAERYKEISPRL
jgi:hypothetical protein